jgi:hypothetical protein
VPRAITKDGLLAASEARYRALLALVDALPLEALEAEFAFEDRDRRVRDVLGHLHAWHLMMLGWHEEGSAGRRPAVPAAGHTWSTLPDLNREIWQRYQDRDLASVRADLDVTHQRLQELKGRRTDAELLTKELYPWTGSTSLGAYLVSSTSNHYDWAIEKLKWHAAAQH